MRYISETKLREMFKSEGYPEELAKIVISAITEEIPITQWQTLEEFKVNPVDGPCWIYHKTEESVFISHYEDECFYTDSTSYDAWYEEENITHVMLIPKPEAPK